MISNDRQASQLLLSDLVENILRYSDNPGECGRYMTSQIRELVGVRSVAFFSSFDKEHAQLVAVCPQRKTEFWNQESMRCFIAEALKIDAPQIVTADSEAGRILTTAGISESFIIPLTVGTEKMGMIVLLDLLDLKGAEIILSTLKGVAPILSLILRNSLLYRNLEEIVEARTTQLTKSEHLFRSIFEQTLDGIIFLNTDGRVTAVNNAFAQMHGYTSEEIMQPDFAGFAPDSSGFVAEQILRLLAGETLAFEENHLHKDGHLIPLEVTASLILLPNEKLILVNYRDISARKRAEEEHQRYEQQIQINSKLESLGLLAGGIAHDFNNLMGGIFGYLDLATDASDPKKISSYLSKAMTAIGRARGLTQQLLTFAKGGAPIQKIDKLFPFVQEAAQFALSGSNVSSHFDIEPDLWACNYDKNQIGQVIDNLFINAQQAMPIGGTIELVARNISFAEKEHPLLENGNYVKITIKDTGIGIPKELVSRIFDPFFTTKPKGHGLGLATCHSIIKRHGGCIDVDSEPGKGSSFHVYLPAIMESGSSHSTKSANKHKGTGVFLVMDDEEIMRETITDMLNDFGYSVVCKENGEEAVDFFLKENEGNRTFAGIILDLTVPGAMGGKATVAEIRKIDPDIPVFVVSGYAEDPVMKAPAKHGFTASICKPFRKSELSEMLNRYLKPKE